MKKIKSWIYKVSLFAYAISFLTALSVNTFASVGCYFCIGATCIEQTGGSGWTDCIEGYTNCGLGGSSCTVGERPPID